MNKQPKRKMAGVRVDRYVLPVRPGAANAGWAWLRFVDWRPCVVHAYLSPGGGDMFYQYRA